jgi:hypothetical protein
MNHTLPAVRQQPVEVETPRAEDVTVALGLESTGKLGGDLR